MLHEPIWQRGEGEGGVYYLQNEYQQPLLYPVSSTVKL
jgi:hypothetical protein